MDAVLSVVYIVTKCIYYCDSFCKSFLIVFLFFDKQLKPQVG